LTLKHEEIGGDGSRVVPSNHDPFSQRHAQRSPPEDGGPRKGWV